MENTLKMFMTLDSSILYTSTLEELSTQYKLNHSPQILANVFIRQYDLICSVGAKFFSLSTDDISSISVYTIDYCLLNYSNKQNTKFTTYFYSVLYNKCNTEEYQRTRQKRLYNYMYKTVLLEADDEQNEEIDNINITKTNYIYDVEFEDNLLTQLCIETNDNLTGKEKLCCEYIMQSPRLLSKTEMADMLNVSRPTLYSILKSLRMKLEGAFV